MVCDHERVQETITLRPRFGQVLTVIVAVIVAGALVSFIVVGDVAGLLRFVWPFLLLAYTTWLLFWSPSVTIDPAGVVVRNLLREHRVTWPAIMRIDTKFALTLYTETRRISAWAAPAPGRAPVAGATRDDIRGLPESTYGAGGSIRPGDLPTTESGQAGLITRLRWEELRDSGLLDSALIEGTGVVTRVLTVETLILAALAAATVATLLL